MKKNLLLFSALLMSASVFSQFTQANEPEVGQGRTLYVIDSLAPSFENTTGAGVTWDYSSYGGYENQDRTVTVQNAADAPNGSDFGSSTFAINIQDFLVTFLTSDADERNMQGFVFIEPSFGTIVATYDADVLQYDYPFAFGDEISSEIDGEAIVPLLGNLPFDGETDITVDGTGTLVLANGVSYTNVYRYRIEEEIDVDAGIAFGQQTFNRVQYEYYDMGDTDNGLPVFVHTSGVLAPSGGGAPLFDFTLVMSIEEPEELVNLENVSFNAGNIYPNPAENVLNIDLFNADTEANLSVVDAMGRIVLNRTLLTAQNNIDISSLNKGVYFVKIAQNGKLMTRKIVKQ
jgi:hemin uptake protein HemP